MLKKERGAAFGIGESFVLEGKYRGAGHGISFHRRCPKVGPVVSISLCEDSVLVAFLQKEQTANSVPPSFGSCADCQCSHPIITLLHPAQVAVERTTSQLTIRKVQLYVL